MAKPIIEMQGIVKRFFTGSPSELEVLHGIDLTVWEGEFVAIVGASGSGKSTLAKHLNGLLLPTEGDVWIEGMNTREDDHIWNIRSTVGMVFQNPDNQIVSSVVEDDVAFGPENLMHRKFRFARRQKSRRRSIL